MHDVGRRNSNQDPTDKRQDDHDDRGREGSTAGAPVADFETHRLDSIENGRRLLLRLNLDHCRVELLSGRRTAEGHVEAPNLTEREGHTEGYGLVGNSGQPHPLANRRKGRGSKGRSSEIHLEGQPHQSVGVDLRQAVCASEGAVVEFDDVGRHQHRDVGLTRSTTEEMRTVTIGIIAALLVTRTGSSRPTAIHLSKCIPKFVRDQIRIDAVRYDLGLKPGAEDRVPARCESRHRQTHLRIDSIDSIDGGEVNQNCGVESVPSKIEAQSEEIDISAPRRDLEMVCRKDLHQKQLPHLETQCEEERQRSDTQDDTHRSRREVAPVADKVGRHSP